MLCVCLLGVSGDGTLHHFSGEHRGRPTKGAFSSCSVGAQSSDGHSQHAVWDQARFGGHNALRLDESEQGIDHRVVSFCFFPFKELTVSPRERRETKVRSETFVRVGRAELSVKSEPGDRGR